MYGETIVEDVYLFERQHMGEAAVVKYYANRKMLSENMYLESVQGENQHSAMFLVKCEGQREIRYCLRTGDALPGSEEQILVKEIVELFERKTLIEFKSIMLNICKFRMQSIDEIDYFETLEFIKEEMTVINQKMMEQKFQH